MGRVVVVPLADVAQYRPFAHARNDNGIVTIYFDAADIPVGIDPPEKRSLTRYQLRRALTNLGYDGRIERLFPGFSEATQIDLTHKEVFVEGTPALTELFVALGLNGAARLAVFNEAKSIT